MLDHQLSVQFLSFLDLRFNEKLHILTQKMQTSLRHNFTYLSVKEWNLTLDSSFNEN